MTVAAVVLAAGEASRFGAPKQRLLLPAVLERLRGAQRVGEVVVVTGAHAVDPPDARTVHCPDWERGPGASLRCGLAALPGETAAVVVVLADGPDLSPAAVDRVVEAWQAGAGPVVAASYDGERGHPVLLARAVWADVPDEGARALEPVLVACDDLGAPGDVDRPGDLPPALRTGAGPEWQAEEVVGEGLARRLVRAQLPGVEARSLELLGEGWDNTVWLADGRWVLRFPRRAVAVPGIKRQIALLPALAPHLPLPVPAPVHVGRPSDAFRWPFSASPLLPGRELAAAGLDDARRAALAEPLAAFLRALHDPALPSSLPGAAALPLDPNRRADGPYRADFTRRRFAELERLGLWRPTAAAQALVEDAGALPPSAAAPVVAHGDLHLRHLLVGGDGRPSAVIDWDDVCLADPAIDLAIVWMALPPAGRDAFFAAYGPLPPEGETRARLLAVFLAATFVLYAHHEGARELGREALATLERAAG